MKTYRNQLVALNALRESAAIAWDNFVLENNLPAINSKLEIVESRNGGFRFKLKDAGLHSSQLGVFANVVKSASLYIFNGGAVNIKEQSAGEFCNDREMIWCGLTISYEAISGGSNGMTYIIEKDNAQTGANGDIWYDIPTRKFYTRTEAFKLEQARNESK